MPMLEASNFQQLANGVLDAHSADFLRMPGVVSVGLRPGDHRPSFVIKFGSQAAHESLRRKGLIPASVEGLSVIAEIAETPRSATLHDDFASRPKARTGLWATIAKFIGLPTH